MQSQPGGEIFVFGSNLAGRHGKGAALHAARHYGAQRGESHGFTGNSYALPTKDANLHTLPLVQIEENIIWFLKTAKCNPNLRFLLTPIGCGLAGYTRQDIWRILEKHGVPSNVVLTSTWVTE